MLLGRCPSLIVLVACSVKSPGCTDQPIRPVCVRCRVLAGVEARGDDQSQYRLQTPFLDRREVGFTYWEDDPADWSY